MKRLLTLAAALLTLAHTAPAELQVIMDDPFGTDEITTEPTAGELASRALRDASASLDAPPGMGRIELSNGDRITGLLERAEDPAGTLVVRHAHFREPVAILLTSLRKYQAAASASALVRPTGWAVTLANGDLLRGNLSGLSADTLALDTWYSGPITIPRAHIQSMLQRESEGMIVEGLGEESDWTTSGPAPRFLGDAITFGQNTVVSRELSRMPPKLRIDFDLRWTWHCYVRLMFYSDKLGEQNSHNAYALQIQGANRLDLHRMTRQQGSRQIANINLGGGRSGEQQSARYTMLFDAEQGRMLVYLDDQQVADWKDLAKLDAYGKVLTLTSMQNFPVELLALRVTEWDGRPLSNETPPEIKEGREVVRLRNGDLLSGKIGMIQDGKALVATSFGNLEIPTDRLGQILLAAAGEQPVPPTGAVRLTLFDGTQATLTAARLSRGQFEGNSPSAGRLRIPLASVRTIEWNLAKTEQAAEASKPADAENAVIIRHLH